MKRRGIFGLLFAAVLISEILIGKYAHGFVRLYIGDVLVMPCMYFLVRSFTHRCRFLVPLLLVFAFGVEISQYFELYKLLGFAPDSLPAIIMGTGFDFGDLISYTAGSVINLGFEVLLGRVDTP